jgi:hypothetical protein
MSHEEIDTTLGLLALLSIIIALILQVVFGQITVRRLRKNPETKHKLGMEYVSGMDIVGVAQVLSWPKSLTFRSSKRTFSLLPNAELLYKHTTKMDRFIGRLFYWTLIEAVVCVLIWIAVTSIN